MLAFSAIPMFDRMEEPAQESGNAYFSVKLDSSFLPKPVNCALMPQDDGSHILVWSRDDRRQA